MPGGVFGRTEETDGSGAFKGLEKGQPSDEIDPKGQGKILFRASGSRMKDEPFPIFGWKRRPKKGTAQCVLHRTRRIDHQAGLSQACGNVLGHVHREVLGREGRHDEQIRMRKIRAQIFFKGGRGIVEEREYEIRFQC
ncbi:hypothetical protein TRIP_B50254 [uncultured Desulfatiglans sp.]|nr:hypothetical protein TRIP_B50254 [uncultured Desulfatiglans sp.]